MRVIRCWPPIRLPPRWFRSRREERYTGDSRSMTPLRPQGSHRALWPDGKSFAFTVFDDPDSQTLEAGREVYAFLASLGFRTTKGVWPIRGSGTPSDHGGTCAEPAFTAPGCKTSNGKDLKAPQRPVPPALQRSDARPEPQSIPRAHPGTPGVLGRPICPTMIRTGPM